MIDHRYQKQENKSVDTGRHLYFDALDKYISV